MKKERKVKAEKVEKRKEIEKRQKKEREKERENTELKFSLCFFMDHLKGLVFKASTLAKVLFAQIKGINVHRAVFN